MSDQQLDTTPPVIRVSPDDVLSEPYTRTWVFGGTKSGKVVSAFWAYINEVVAQNQQEAQRQAERAVNWSTLLGRPLTTDEVQAVHDAARKLSTVTTMSYDDAAAYILGLMHNMRIVTVDYAHTPDWSGVLYPQRGGTGPNYDHWWVGLEDVERRNMKRAAYARLYQANTRGSYQYGSVKACSFWRHTRAR